jgi:hypothetical protein
MSDQIKINYNDFRRIARTLDEVTVPDGKEYGTILQSTDGLISCVLDSHGNITITKETTND